MDEPELVGQLHAVTEKPPTILVWENTRVVDHFATIEQASQDFERLYPHAYYMLVGTMRLWVVRACWADRDESLDATKNPRALMIELRNA